jgi:hypothetical protein
LAVEAELRKQDSEDSPLSEGDITPEANKGEPEPTPGVPKAAALPAEININFDWPKYRKGRGHSGGKRKF